MSNGNAEFLKDPEGFMEKHLVLIENFDQGSGGPYCFDLEPVKNQKVEQTRWNPRKKKVYKLEMRGSASSEKPPSPHSPSSAAAASSSSSSSAQSPSPPAAKARAASSPSSTSHDDGILAYWLRYKSFSPYYDRCDLGTAANFFFTAELSGCRLDFADIQTANPKIIHIDGTWVQGSNDAMRQARANSGIGRLDSDKKSIVDNFKSRVSTSGGQYSGKYSQKHYGKDGLVTVWGRSDAAGRWQFYAQKRRGASVAKAAPTGIKPGSTKQKWSHQGNDPIRFGGPDRVASA
jgi:hypothetical protein